MYIFLSTIRLTTDVQDFKSSFKECISQGLRSITQVIGGVVSLYVISPQMTLLVVLGLPLMIGVGGLIGSGLRQLARRSQEQVCIFLLCILAARLVKEVLVFHD